MTKIKVEAKATLLVVVDSVGNTCEIVYQDFEDAIQVYGLQQPDPSDPYNAIDIPNWQDDAKHFGSDDYCQKYNLAYSFSELKIQSEVELDVDHRLV